MTQHKTARAGLAAFGFAAAAVSLALLAAPASAQSISKQGFNFNNVPGCPGKAPVTNGTVNTIGTDKFSDGSPLPSCGGRETNGTIITTYKLVWTGRVWAKYPPSVQQTNTAPPTPTVAAPPKTVPGIAPSGPTVSPAIVATLPAGILNGQQVYLFQKNWVGLVASGGGNWNTRLVASGGGNLVASGGGNYNLQSVGSGGAVKTTAGNVALSAADVARYKAAMGIR